MNPSRISSSSNRNLSTRIANVAFRPEGAIKAKLEWFKEEIGYGGKFLSTHPKLLVYSLEKRVIPRYKVLASLKEKNVLKSKLSLCSVVALSEEKFVRDFVLPYCEVVPSLYENYTKSTRSNNRLLASVIVAVRGAIGVEAVDCSGGGEGWVDDNGDWTGGVTGTMDLKLKNLKSNC
ncbi:mitochodrial transcription termination factor [Tanacetum coccineum]|uniref:Mitochodrial transcription termination factor n=1 Tax=Tanacetum coccineum TaxID=301880 RepID=A0ABQ5FLA4_9ASTR